MTETPTPTAVAQAAVPQTGATSYMQMPPGVPYPWAPPPALSGHGKAWATVAGVAAILAGVVSYFMGLTVAVTANWFTLWVSRTFRTIPSRTVFTETMFVVLAILFALVAVAAFLVLRELREKVASVVLQVVLGLYAADMLMHAWAYHILYVPHHANLRWFTTDLPIYLVTTAMIVVFVVFLRLFKRLNTAGKVFAVLGMIGAVSVTALMIVVLNGAVIAPTMDSIWTRGTWFTSSALTFALFGCVLLTLGAGRRQVAKTAG